MPAKSGKQLRAMYAAAAGHSTLGIPAKVGKEFIKETPKTTRKTLLSHHQKAATGFRRRQKGGYV